MKDVATRCRFAPSPTGYLHVGSAQSAMFNWMFARHNGGEFLLRIEDTDAERNRPELTSNILDMLHWLQIQWDGEPFHQSDRQEEHRREAAALYAQGDAYACDCTAEDVAARKPFKAKAGYDGFCRDRGLDPGIGRALRFRMPDGHTSWDDIVRGTVTFDHRNLEDFVVVRSNGTPTYVLANPSDDAAMAITHVIRGEDHINNTAKYIALWLALDWGTLPTFAHLPLLVNAQRKKLSKRRDSVSVGEFKDKGYLAEALRNYLALLGWGPSGDDEIMAVEDMVAAFRLEDVSPSPAFFDEAKLEHINGVYMRRLDRDDFVRRATPFLPSERAVQALGMLAEPVQERVKRLDEVGGYVEFLWSDPEMDEPAWTKATQDERALPMLQKARFALSTVQWTAEMIENAVRGAGRSASYLNASGEVQLSKAQAPIRVALTGRSVGPPLWQSIHALGRDKALERLDRAVERLRTETEAVSSDHAELVAEQSESVATRVVRAGRSGPLL